MVVSGTEDSNCFYSDIFPPLFIHDEYDEEIIKNLSKDKICQRTYF